MRRVLGVSWLRRVGRSTPVLRREHLGAEQLGFLGPIGIVVVNSRRWVARALVRRGNLYGNRSAI
jgi:hypothetical protein